MRTPAQSGSGAYSTPYASWLLLSLAVTFFAACTQAPFTQRRQIIIVSEAQELGVGEVQYQKVLDKISLNFDPEANRIVNTVGQRIARAAGKTNYLWEFVVIDGPETVNAWVLPGGKVGVCTGIFPVAHDETGLAIILAHEVAHAIARHHGEKTTRDLLFEVGGMGVTFAPDLVRQTYNLGTSLGLILPFGRVQEAEADYIGLILAAKAGYDPRAALAVWERIAQAGANRSQPLELLSTHPNYDTRRQNIEKWLPEALSFYNGALAAPSIELPALDSLERPPVIEEKETPEQEQQVAPYLALPRKS